MRASSISANHPASPAKKPNTAHDRIQKRPHVDAGHHRRPLRAIVYLIHRHIARMAHARHAGMARPSIRSVRAHPLRWDRIHHEGPARPLVPDPPDWPQPSLPADRPLVLAPRSIRRIRARGILSAAKARQRIRKAAPTHVGAAFTFF